MNLEIKDICKRYGEKEVLSHFSASFPEGQVSAIMAPSGTGKTTLLRLILGLEKPDSGEITGVPEKMSALFQEDRLCPGLSALTNIRFVVGKQVSEQKIKALLTELGLGESMTQPVSELSGGMSRRAALARALLYPGELLVLDEPFTGLDGENREIAARAILRCARGRTILLVTHRQEDIRLLDAKHLVEIPGRQ